MKVSLLVGAVAITADVLTFGLPAKTPPGQSHLNSQRKNDFATNYANYAKTTTAEEVNDEETARNSPDAKTAKKNAVSLLFSRLGRFWLLLLTLSLSRNSPVRAGCNSWLSALNLVRLP
jgi:hypothetical protein